MREDGVVTNIYPFGPLKTNWVGANRIIPCQITHPPPPPPPAPSKRFTIFVLGNILEFNSDTKSYKNKLFLKVKFKVKHNIHSWKVR